MTTKLKTDPRIPNPDTFYIALADLHKDVSLEESLVINAKLVFLLANHIGDQAVLMEAIEAVKSNRRP
jgi:hypothetical protein